VLRGSILGVPGGEKGSSLPGELLAGCSQEAEFAHLDFFGELGISQEFATIFLKEGIWKEVSWGFAHQSSLPKQLTDKQKPRRHYNDSHPIPPSQGTPCMSLFSPLLRHTTMAQDSANWNPKSTWKPQKQSRMVPPRM